MNVLRCSETQDELALARLEGGTLSVAAEDHFRSCPACRLERVRLEEILGGLDADTVPDPGEAYWSSFLWRVRKRVAAESPSSTRRTPARWWALAAAAASFFTAAVAVGGWRIPAELDATARLHRLALGNDPERLEQALDLIAPDRQPDWVGEEPDEAAPLAAHFEDALEVVFPETEPGIYEASGEPAVEPQRLVQDQGWV